MKIKIDLMTEAIVDGNLCGADCPHLEQDSDVCWAMGWLGDDGCLLFRVRVGHVGKACVRCTECVAATLGEVIQHGDWMFAKVKP
jgi:hypothetical protein